MTEVWITLQEQQHRTVIAFGELVEELLIKSKTPADLTLGDKSGFFGIEAHLKTPVELIAIALLARRFKSYKILIVDSFQLMDYEKSNGNTGTSPKEVSDAVGKTRHELEQIARTFNLNFDVALCSQFFKTDRYRAILRYASGIVDESPEIRRMLREAVPASQNKDDISFGVNELATVIYMGLFEGADVKVGQSREALYDKPLQAIPNQIRAMNFAYLIPFYALGTQVPEEVTPYSPTSGTKNGGKRILIDEFDKRNYRSMLERRQSGPAQAQLGFNRLTLAAAAAVQGKTEFIMQERIDNAFLSHVVRPYEMRKIDDCIERACNNI